jgi:hypothetical protein
MNIVKELNHQDNLGFYRLDISTVNDIVIIKYNTLPKGYEMLPDDEMHIVQMNVKNIPAIISGLHRVFQSPEGDYLSIRENDDRIRISMPLNYDRGYFDSIAVMDVSQRIKTCLSWSIDFEFEKPIYTTYPLPRIPTPSMIWFTDTLKQIHDEWEKQQSGGQGAQV